MPKKPKTKLGSALKDIGKDIKAGLDAIGDTVGKTIDKVEDGVESALFANKIRYWASGERDSYPELGLREIRARSDFGVCFSGGGTRSASATLGQLRALKALGLLDKARYVSAISGGSWASTPFIFLPSAVSDDSFLGEYLPPQRLDARNLAAMSANSNSLAYAISRSKITAKVLKHYFAAKGTSFNLLPRGSRDDESFARSVGEIFLKPFGLYEGAGTQKFFSWNGATRDEILSRNRHLERDDFYVTHRPRPYFIVGGCIHNDLRFAHYELTPLYVGSSQRHKSLLGQNVGGGYIEPTGFDSFAPNEPLRGGTTQARLGKAFHRLSLSDLIGTSGAAPSFFSHAIKPGIPLVAGAAGAAGAAVGAAGAASGAAAALAKLFSEVFPRFRHWPVREGERVIGRELDFGDGGYVDSYGIIPLLKRRVKKIACFINTSTALKGRLEDFREGGDFEIDASLPLLFGEKALVAEFPPNWIQKTADCQVLRNEGGAPWEETLKQLLVSKGHNTGGPVCARSTYTTRRNEFYGVPEGHQVEIMWFYLEACTRWEEALSAPLRGRLEADRLKRSKTFSNFPHYGTFLENPGLTLEAVDLEPEQVSMLAQLSAWAVMEKREALRELAA